MPSARTQDYRNHRRFTPLYHFVTMPLVATYLGWSISRVWNDANADTWYMLVGALAIFFLYLVARMQPLKVQDRVIRLEERLRLTRLLPADLQPHIESIRASHLLALRFADDAEVPDLVRAIIADPRISPDLVKRSIRNWRADWFRA
jgi:hypothetical protein